MPTPRISVTSAQAAHPVRVERVDDARDRPRAAAVRRGRCRSTDRAVRFAGIVRNDGAEARGDGVGTASLAGPPARPPRHVVLPDCAWIHTEMKRHKHVTLQLRVGGISRDPRGAGAALQRVLRTVSQWAKRLQRSMRQRHYAGEKLFVDYAGSTVPIYGATCEEAFRATHLCRRIGRERLCIRGSDAHRVVAGLARQSCADAGVLWLLRRRFWCLTIRASA